MVYTGDTFTFYAIYKYVCHMKLRPSVCIHHLPSVFISGLVHFTLSDSITLITVRKGASKDLNFSIRLRLHLYQTYKFFSEVFR
jgi:hypothetical protein